MMDTGSYKRECYQPWLKSAGFGERTGHRGQERQKPNSSFDLVFTEVGSSRPPSALWPGTPARPM